MLVIVALAIFIASLFTAYSLYVSLEDQLRFRESAQDFAERIYSNDLLTGGIEPGRFFATSLTADVRAKIEASFHPDSLGFHYNITVSDVSDYLDKYPWHAGENVPSGQIRTITKPIVIVSADVTHAALLVVKAWT